MIDKYSTTAEKKALAQDFKNKILSFHKELKQKLSEDKNEFFSALNGYTHTETLQDFYKALHDPDIIPSEYLKENMKDLFDLAIPPRDREVIYYFADRICEYPYSDSYYRRSFRRKQIYAYTKKIASIIRAYFGHFGYIIDAPIEKILNRELPADAQAYVDEYSYSGRGYTSWQVAYALDHHNLAAEDAVRRILTEENSSSSISTELIRGVLFSHREEFHQLLGKLLLAARLQEGLRQAICENAEYGTRKGFLEILKVISENNLIRFSSVKRAVGTWLGIMSEDSRDLERISEKSVRLIIECLENSDFCEKYLESEDAMELYIALWSLGFIDINLSVKKIYEIAESGSKHQLLVAGYFAGNMDLPHTENRIAKEIIRAHHEKEDVLAIWLPSILPNGASYLWNAVRENRPVTYETWFDSDEEIAEQYGIIRKVHDEFSGKKKTFSPCVFPWYEASISRADLAGKLCNIAAISENNSLIDDASALIKECDSDHRPAYFSSLLREPKTPIQRNAVIEALADKETYTRRSAYGIIKNLDLTCEEYKTIEGYLRFKSADMRQYVIETLQKQDNSALIASVRRLLENGKEDVRLGGLDILSQIKKSGERTDVLLAFGDYLAKYATCDSLSSKEKVLLEALAEDKSNSDATTSLFFPEDRYNPTNFDREYTERSLNAFLEIFPESLLPKMVEGKGGILGKFKSAMSGKCKTAVTALADLTSLSKFIDDHKTVPYTKFEGEDVLLGNVRFAHQIRAPKDGTRLTYLWDEWYAENKMTDKRLIPAVILFNAYSINNYFSEKTRGYVKDIFGLGFEYMSELPYSGVMGGVIPYLLERVSPETLSLIASAVTLWFIKCVPDDMVIVKSDAERKGPYDFGVAHLLAHKQINLVYSWLDCRSGDALKYTFPLAVASAERCVSASQEFINSKIKIGTSDCYATPISNVRSLARPFESYYGLDAPLIGTKEYLFAAYQGVISERALFEFILAKSNIQSSIDLISSIASVHYEGERQVSTRDTYKNLRNSRKMRDFIDKEGALNEEDMKLIRFVAHIYDILIPFILSSELSRGDSPTPYTRGANSIARIYGVKYLVDILSSMGSDTLDRTAYHGWGVGTGRKSSLSYLLSVCIPGEGDTADTLRAALRGKKISEKRLIETALFSPEWIPIIGEYLGIPSFTAVCYYFMAHINDNFDDKRKAMIAKFTPLSSDELNLGAFDVSWFKSSYESVGESTFNLIYDSAKYIADGARHTRARKYADAALGKLSVDESEEAIVEKRNKDLLMAYALIPLSGEDDICHRYLYLQKFLKESKKFGSQRSASEAKAVEMALTNLAINAGYSDTMRLTLRMETKVIDDSRDLLKEHIIDGVSLKIIFDEVGKASLAIRRDGKELKSIPGSLKKNDKVVALSAMVKNLVEQYRRTRIMLERAMEDRVEFGHSELVSLLDHPVVEPMLRNLVLVSETADGFIDECGLRSVSGDVNGLPSDAKVRIAHPYDFYSKGSWSAYQCYLYENKITQPFRQVFRELYVKTEEEMNMLHSLRYAGNQLQPTKTVSVLKSRRWVADVECGLQKVYYKENIVARIYALADWFSPADIEAPTLEWVCFSNRKTNEDIRISDIPEVIFSEVMRDVDLAVSVAHAGGVDPETSHSTMEMRAAIITHLLPMLRIENVKIEDRHAIISGNLADYSVHLGSGVVHQLGGAMIPILPVHSQHKGRIFLPFVDDDPKTAEIISKIILLTDDSKIKDPTILSSISRRD